MSPSSPITIALHSHVNPSSPITIALHHSHVNSSSPVDVRGLKLGLDAVVASVALSLVPEHGVETVRPAKLRRECGGERGHLLDGVDGQIAARHDPTPVDKARPTDASVEEDDAVIVWNRRQQQVGERLGGAIGSRVLVGIGRHCECVCLSLSLSLFSLSVPFSISLSCGISLCARGGAYLRESDVVLALERDHGRDERAICLHVVLDARTRRVRRVPRGLAVRANTVRLPTRPHHVPDLWAVLTENGRGQRTR